MELNPRKAALLVIDMQNYFLDPSSPSFLGAGSAILGNVRRLIDFARGCGVRVIYTSHAHHQEGIDAGILGWWWADMCIEGSEGSRIHSRIEPRGDEKLIQKHRYSAFFNTDLETILRCIDAEDLIISGVMTNICCESTARDAYFRDYRVFFVADATATTAEEMHRGTLLNLAYAFAYVTTTDQLIESSQK
jgi:ureidoacrylate peracid hydrolase